MKVLRFNQDVTCCVVSPSPSLVSIYNCDPFGKCFEMDTGCRESNSGDSLLAYRNDSNGDMQNENFVVEMLFSTSLVAIADKSQGSASAKRLKIVNTKRKSTICEISFPHQIVDVVMNRKRMCILLESDQIFIYDISCMKLLETIDLWEDHFKRNGATNPASLKSRVGRSRSSSLDDRRRKPKLVLSGDDRSILCFTSYSSQKNNPDSVLLHDLVIYDTLNVCPINYLNSVHKGDVVCIAISHNGKLVSTASEKGTIIRVFNTGVDTDYEAGSPIVSEFRRGSRPSRLYQLVFNRNATMLGSVGDTDTIHIFDLENRQNEDLTPDESELLLANEENNQKIASQNPDPSKQIAHFISKSLSSSIPSQHLRRNFAQITIHGPTGHCLGFPEEFPHQIYIASDDGKFRVYTLPSTTGECVLTKTSTFA